MRITASARSIAPEWLAGVLLPALAGAAGAASAHHSFAPYDMERTITVEGTVVEYLWHNPHVELTVRDADDVLWLIETDSPATMTRSRWSRDTFTPGDPVSVRFNPNRDAAIKSGVLLTVRGADWVSRGSTARTGTPTTTTAAAMVILALSIAAAVAASYRKHRSVDGVVGATLGAGIVVWTVQFSFTYTGQVLGTALLLGAALWTVRRARLARP